MKALLVEDDPLLGDLFSVSLLDAGFELAHSTSGEDALIQAPLIHPDIILLDIILPGINGFEVLEKLKADPLVLNIPVIMISNLGDQSNIDHALALGAVDYFVKSNVLPRDIIAKAKSILSIS